jgi:excinuclease ABC subunit A
VLQTLADVGLEYLSLGQPAPTLSGGEAQRVKLAAELSRPNTGRTVYLLDEPTTGLHFDDIHKLLEVLNRLVDLGNTAIVVEHNMDVIKTADWVLDLGPEAGEAGGSLVAVGTPEQVARAPGSHTGAILAEALAEGQYAARTKYDPFAAEATQEGDLELNEVGKDAQMPWESDGRRWHTVERVSHKGTPCRWEGSILDWIDQRIHDLGSFSDTNWNHRSVVEIAAASKSQGWFFHGHSGLERYVRLVFHVGRNTFKESALRERLGIRKLNELEGLDVYGDEPRVQVANRKGPWQEVAILAHRLSEIDTTAFRKFLEEAAAAFQNNLRRLQTSPEDVMPWKVNGQRWHLSDKGFPVGKRVEWDRSLLPRLLDVVREVEPGLEVVWTGRALITLKVPGIKRSWAYWRTKASYGLDCRFLGKKGQFNLSRIESFGVSPSICDHAKDYDTVQLVFQNAEHVHAAKLKEFLAEQVRGFQEVFGKN